MRILVTNDDGIHAEGLYRLAKAMARLGEVTVVAPLIEHSAVGHAITLTDPLRVEKVFHDGHLFGRAVNGTPADCVKLAVRMLMHEPPDLVVSGINHGANTGHNVIYSGTVSAATEGAILAIPAFAISRAWSLEPDFSPAAEIAVEVAERLLAHHLPDGVLLNVNVPAIARDEIRGFRVTEQGQGRFVETFEARVDPRGKQYFWQAGETVIPDHGETIDDTALEEGYVAITPIHFDLTARPFMAELASWGW
ncbi:MAG: 5'/3'-nucleotidase SurE [Nitrospirae bacterium CG18_big_fil_WC_8_21_14_2_50_70_55]|nr:5'/3'-nucleotidase SurE [Deltaproteobacteria bacterium]OIP63373.1 MAG: 5'/3'-nucleotidase SurE [Nitrospirae bacterium CG2_30_70_394]PIQ05391.1 MAG: 5'/3'-nucleotidase SurE [Nitrospirae bacterium CG18_big_fil_WC_8_21_14_2_50_70_55]PIU80046.1 MAG: 5'/3'-nucleotidase SurE [Nitrospirae bacterium CG06_land_8_20_14_3_00_70_43]PIW83512.1 MAG: 5'/3'-nucleotidase SurE [Nitrospirae bacterium CG_4_8_14_3_um_filter_70_85]PIX84299.1 MAG: 5'/3'-nucleotidase SurE [Nitrospirae bacterium CG_4_10_14_3_um_fil